MAENQHAFCARSGKAPHVTLGNSIYAAEWLDRLVAKEPDALHFMLAGGKAPKLWDACVYDDPDSPSAVDGEGCLCWQNPLRTL